jgi:hypothetical protein
VAVLAETQPWTITGVKVANYTAAPWEHVRVGASVTITLPATPSIGDRVAVGREGNFAITVAANAGQTVDGIASRLLSPTAVVTNGVAVYQYVAANTWVIAATANTDAGGGLGVTGYLNAQGGVGANITNISAAATVTGANAILNCTTPSATYALTFGTGLRTGQMIWVYNGGTVAITLAATGSGSIVGGTTVNPGQTVQCLAIVAGANPVIVTIPGTQQRDIQTWLVAGTYLAGSGGYVKPSGNPKTIRVITQGGGAGGGSGRRGAAGSVRCGGGGGGGGALSDRVISAAIVSATEQILVGAGGNGGAAQTANDTDGLTGVGGTTSYFGVSSGTVYGTRAGAGGPGGPGTNAAGTGGSAGIGAMNGSAGTGAAASGTGGVGAAGTNGSVAGGGGGSGGGITSGDVAGNGGNGGTNNMLSSTGISTGGVVDTTAPTAIGGNAQALAGWFGGNGGGGGAASKTAAAQAGAAAGLGAGGGGGGASLNGFNSGAGGRGGDGFVVAITEF